MSEFNGLGLKCGCALLVFIMSTGNEPLVLIESTNGILDVLLQYGLYLGAVFQLICIFAAVLIPTSADGQVYFPIIAQYFIGVLSVQ